MVLSKSVAKDLFRQCLKTVNYIQKAKVTNRAYIGNRDFVCFGTNGSAVYLDMFWKPFPAIRFKENTNELLALREKEKGDWRKLSIEEKKTLYRASFRQTYEEMTAPTGGWKVVTGAFLFFTALSLWFFILMREFLYKPRFPHTFSEENRRKLLRVMLDLKMEPITGISSKWDYENDDWKK